MSEKAAVKETAKRIARGQRKDDEIFELSTGVRVRLHPVSSSLVEEMRRSIPMPEVPKVWIEEKEREEENPNDPDYVAAIEETEIKRTEAMWDTLVTFGVELIDGLPENDIWLRKLQLLERRGGFNLSGFDLNDEFDLEFLYKRYVIVAGDDLQLIGALHGFKPLEVARARAMFLGDEGGDTNRRVPPERDGKDTD